MLQAKKLAEKNIAGFDGFQKNLESMKPSLNQILKI